MRLVKGSDVIELVNENWISAYKEAGYVEEAEPKAEPPKKKASTKNKE